MYLVDADELTTIVRVRRRDVLTLLREARQQNESLSFEDLLAVADDFIDTAEVHYDYLSDYASEEANYQLPVVPVEEVVDSAEPEAEHADLDGDNLFDVVEDGAYVDPMTEPDQPVQMSDEELARLDAEVEPAADELIVQNDAEEIVTDDDTVEEPVTEQATEDDSTPEVVDDATTKQATMEETDAEGKVNKYSLRALQRELRSVDRA